MPISSPLPLPLLCRSPLLPLPISSPLPTAAAVLCRAHLPHYPMSESWSSGSIYVPRDEAFSDVKQLTFSGMPVYSVLHALIPSIETAIVDIDLGFPYFTAIDSLFDEGVNLLPLSKNGLLKDLLPRLVKFVSDAEESLLRFETPAMFERDKFSWLRDEEFSRQTLGGLNPCSIQLVKVNTCRSIVGMVSSHGISSFSGQFIELAGGDAIVDTDIDLLKDEDRVAMVDAKTITELLEASSTNPDSKSATAT